MSAPTQSEVLAAIRKAANDLGRIPSKREFMAHSGLVEYHVLSNFPSWVEAVRAAGLDIQPGNVKLGPEPLLEDWGRLVRRLRRIPTRMTYRREGSHSANTFDKHVGPWSAIPTAFRKWAHGKEEWTDVLAMIPLQADAAIQPAHPSPTTNDEPPSTPEQTRPRHTKLGDRPTYGNPIDFRGLRHEPVNESGVVFLFGMVARELGYLVEAVQAGYPDCEAKRQIGPGKWQRVRIEFEYESRNFRDHGHSPDGCDVIVCWRHNWPDCPSHLQVVELRQVLSGLAASDE
jgi:Homing endonuclease associated repeat